jgi:FAD/FMN-containing dehydrogenase
MNASLHDKLAALLGPNGYRVEPQDVAPHLVEWRGRYQGWTPFLALPSSTREVAAVVTLCAEHKTAITTQGGNTGLVGAQIPQGEILLSTTRLKSVRSCDPVDDAIVVEAGVVLSQVQAAAQEADRLFPLSLASEGSATIGGLISTNAGGVHVARYGMMRDLVLGIEAVLPDGRVFDGLKTLRKDNTGYDLKQLFIGAEGTLGIVTAASLKLYPRPSSRFTAMASIASPERALPLLHRLKNATGAVAAFEFMNRISIDLTLKNVADLRDPLPGGAALALIECEASTAGLRDAALAALAAAIEAGEAQDVVVAETEAQTHGFWRLRESLSAGHRPEGAQVNCDISVPVSQTPAFLKQAQIACERLHPGVRIVAFGHMGDGNIHFSALIAPGASAEAFPRAAINEAIHEAAVSLGGSISAEHGIGIARLADFKRFKDPIAIEMMRAIKHAIDPNQIMNPRVLIS